MSNPTGSCGSIQFLDGYNRLNGVREPFPDTIDLPNVNEREPDCKKVSVSLKLPVGSSLILVSE